jgi:hypothetical protein
MASSFAPRVRCMYLFVTVLGFLSLRRALIPWTSISVTSSSRFVPREGHDVGAVTPITCGLVLAPRRLVAVVLEPGGEARRAIRAVLTDDARYGLIEYLAALGCEVIVSDALVRADPVAQRGLRRMRQC